MLGFLSARLMILLGGLGVKREFLLILGLGVDEIVEPDVVVNNGLELVVFGEIFVGFACAAHIVGVFVVFFV